jgi:hypothetical protein
MKYNIRRDKNKKAIFDETGQKISDWWYHIFIDGLVDGDSEFYIVSREDAKEAIFHKLGIQVSEWWNDIHLDGLVDGTSSEYRVCSEKHEIITLIFDRTKFIMDMLKGELKLK